MSTSSLSSQKAATLAVKPKTGLTNNLLGIKVEGLGPRERGPLEVSDRGRLFLSPADNEADGSGAGGVGPGQGPISELWAVTSGVWSPWGSCGA